MHLATTPKVAPWVRQSQASQHPPAHELPVQWADNPHKKPVISFLMSGGTPKTLQSSSLPKRRREDKTESVSHEKHFELAQGLEENALLHQAGAQGWEWGEGWGTEPYIATGKVGQTAHGG